MMEMEAPIFVAGKTGKAVREGFDAALTTHSSSLTLK